MRTLVQPATFRSLWAVRAAFHKRGALRPPPGYGDSPRTPCSGKMRLSQLCSSDTFTETIRSPYGGVGWRWGPWKAQSPARAVCALFLAVLEVFPPPLVTAGTKKSAVNPLQMQARADCASVDGATIRSGQIVRHHIHPTCTSLSRTLPTVAG